MGGVRLAGLLWLETGGTELLERATAALWMLEGAALLGVELDEGVVLVEGFGGPCGGSYQHETTLGLASVGGVGDELHAFGDAEVVAVDAEGLAAQGAEVDDGSAGLDADAVEGFEPRTDLFGLVAAEEVERKGAGAGGDLFEGLLELDGFALGKGGGSDGVFDLGDWGVAEGFPGAEAIAQGLQDLVRGLGFGAGGEQRVDELGERVPGTRGADLP